jgi:hypothetical protein
MLILPIAIRFSCYSEIILSKSIVFIYINYSLLERITGPKRDKVIGGWRRVYSDDLRNLHSSPNIIRMMKSRRVRWGGHVARLGKKRF